MLFRDPVQVFPATFPISAHLLQKIGILIPIVSVDLRQNCFQDTILGWHFAWRDCSCPYCGTTDHRSQPGRPYMLGPGAPMTLVHQILGKWPSKTHLMGHCRSFWFWVITTSPTHCLFVLDWDSCRPMVIWVWGRNFKHLGPQSCCFLLLKCFGVPLDTHFSPIFVYHGY